MNRIVVISQCGECPKQQKNEEWNYNSGKMELIGAICTMTGLELDYMHYCGYALKEEKAFPNTCPLRQTTGDM